MKKLITLAVLMLAVLVGRKAVSELIGALAPVSPDSSEKQLDSRQMKNLAKSTSIVVLFWSYEKLEQFVLRNINNPVVNWVVRAIGYAGGTISFFTEKPEAEMMPKKRLIDWIALIVTEVRDLIYPIDPHHLSDDDWFDLYRLDKGLHDKLVTRLYRHPRQSFDPDTEFHVGINA